jgi:hypothetical protein
VVLVEVGEHDDVDVGCLEPALAQLGKDVLALLDGVVAAENRPRLSRGSLTTDGWSPVSTRMFPALGWRAR